VHRSCLAMATCSGRNHPHMTRSKCAWSIISSGMGSPEGDPGGKPAEPGSGVPPPNPGNAPASADGNQRMPPAHTPDAAAGTQRPPGQAGSNPPPKTTTGRPAPTANATASQEPEPPPETRPADNGAATGRHAAGQTEPTSATNPEPGPPATAAATTARERRANATDGSNDAPAPTPQNTEAPAAAAAETPATEDTDGKAPTPSAKNAAKTDNDDAPPAASAADTTAASAPTQQPTTTERPAPRTEPTSAGTNAGEPPGTAGHNREPANATTPATTTTPGANAPRHHRAGRPPPDRLVHRGEGPAAPWAETAQRRRARLASRPLREREGFPATVKRQGGHSDERPTGANQPGSGPRRAGDRAGVCRLKDPVGWFSFSLRVGRRQGGGRRERRQLKIAVCQRAGGAMGARGSGGRAVGPRGCLECAAQAVARPAAQAWRPSGAVATAAVRAPLVMRSRLPERGERRQSAELVVR
jgi:hypothetical protein